MRSKRYAAVLLAALVGLLSVTAWAEDGAEDRIDTLNDQYTELQQEQSKLNAEIGKVKTEKEKQLVIQNQIVEQVNNTIAQIDILTQRIELLEENIQTKEQEMAVKQTEMDENFALLKTRVRAMYMAGGSDSTLGLVLGADSYAELVMRGEVMGRVAQHDQALIDRLAEEKNQLDEIKRGIEADQIVVESDQAEMVVKKAQLDAEMVEAQDKVQDIAELERQFLADKDAMQKQMAQLQAEISKIYAEINKTSTKLPYVGGVMRWPSDVLTQVSSEFGNRFGGSDNHTGIDIFGSGALGTPVLAANTGTVAVANLNFVPGRDYGKYVILDHGDGIQTLYAHCSALTVKAGQTVAKGEKIGEVGMTGWATGPHIHFEVRKNGVAENPVKWLQG